MNSPSSLIIPNIDQYSDADFNKNKLTIRKFICSYDIEELQKFIKLKHIDIDGVIFEVLF